MDFITIQQAINLISNGAILLDVRTAQEYCEYHICGAINIPTPLPPLNTNQITKFQKLVKKTIKNLNVREKTPIIVYCKKGIRASRAQKYITKLGYKVYNLGGVQTNPIKGYISRTKGQGKLPVCKCS